MDDIQNFQELNDEMKKLIEDVDKIKLSIDLFGKFIDKQLMAASV